MYNDVLQFPVGLSEIAFFFVLFKYRHHVSRSMKIMSFKNITYVVFLISTPEAFISTLSGRVGRKNHSQFWGVPRGSLPRHHLIASWKRIQWAAITLLEYNKIKIIKLKLRLWSYQKWKDFLSSQITGFSKLYVFQ